MSRAFADADYWIALLHPREELHEKATQVSSTPGRAQLVIVTSEMVLAEVLDGLGDRGQRFRELAAETVHRLRTAPNVTVVPQTSAQFRAALEMYRARLDKEWGLTDCASFQIMEQQGITDALTYDHHFEQAGFIALLRS